MSRTSRFYVPKSAETGKLSFSLVFHGNLLIPVFSEKKTILFTNLCNLISSEIIICTSILPIFTKSPILANDHKSFLLFVKIIKHCIIFFKIWKFYMKQDGENRYSSFTGYQVIHGWTLLPVLLTTYITVTTIQKIYMYFSQFHITNSWINYV